MSKTSGNEFLESPGERVFHIFPTLRLIIESAPHTY